MVTLSVIKADTGGYVGHCAVHPEMIAEARRRVADAVGELLIDGQVATCGDDLSLIMSHRHGVGSTEVHAFAWSTFVALTEIAKRLGLYGAGQDMLADAFSGNLRGMGPGYAEMEFTERPSEPILLFLADKTEPGAWNLPLFRMFADPFTTAGLVIDAKMHAGFAFEVYDLYQEKRLVFDCPAEMYDLLMFIGAPARYVVHSVHSKTLDEQAAATSTQRLSLIAGKYVGKDDPVLIVRCQSGLPAVGEALEPFALPYAVAGCMRGSHHAPLMPVPFRHAHPSRFDGPPRVVCLGYQLHEGKFIGPRDMFDDPAFDKARTTANEIMDYLRRHGPFEPHRLPLENLEYTTMKDLEERLADRWHPLKDLKERLADRWHPLAAEPGLPRQPHAELSPVVSELVGEAPAAARGPPEMSGGTRGQAPPGRCVMHTRELHVTIQVDHEASGIRVKAILRDDHPVTGVGWLAHRWTEPFPAREDLAVVRALRDLADRLVDRDRQAHPCAPAPNGPSRAAAAGVSVPTQRWPTCPIAVYEGRAAPPGSGSG